MGKIGFIILIVLLISAIFFLSSCMPQLNGKFYEHRFVFPKDMAPHRNYNSEWWYQTGYLYNKATPSSTPEFGYEFTAFRIYQPSTKRWPKFLGIPAGEIWDIHLSIHDFKTGEKLFTEELELPTLMLFSSVETRNNSLYLKGGNKVKFLFYGDQHKMTLKVSYKNSSLNFDIVAKKEPVLHNNGLVRMDTAVSYYYSITRMDVSGTLELYGKSYKVYGNSWYDQQWGSMEDLSPWDWYSFRFSNNTEIMLFRFPKTGQTYATYIDSKGKTTYCHDATMSFDSSVLINGKKVPIPMPGYVEIPSINATLIIDALSKDQVNITRYTPSYWEGLCSVGGTVGSTDVKGYAYFESWR